MFAPFGTAKVHLWIANLLVAFFTNTIRVVFPEFYLISTGRAMNGKDIFRFPHLLILSGAMQHLLRELRFNLFWFSKSKINNLSTNLND
jgi:hypothetical protein